MRSGIAAQIVVANLMAVLFSSVADAGLARSVSMVALIASPARYEDQRVAVVGYHYGDLIPAVIYLSREAALLADVSSSIAVENTIDGQRFGELTRCLNQYVSVTGIFKEIAVGVYGLTDIEHVVAHGEPSSEEYRSQTCYSGESGSE